MTEKIGYNEIILEAEGDMLLSIWTCTHDPEEMKVEEFEFTVLDDGSLQLFAPNVTRYSDSDDDQYCVFKPHMWRKNETLAPANQR